MSMSSEWCSKSLIANEPDIVPIKLEAGMSISKFLNKIGKTCFEARVLFKGAELFKNMINNEDVIWLGIAGAGIVGGLGGIVSTLLQKGFINVICSTGAQVYHDLHFAFGLPVKAINPNSNDEILRNHGDTRIYDIGIRETETMEAQDSLIQQFVKEEYNNLKDKVLSSWEFTYLLGKWVDKKAKYPERSFVVVASRLKIPVFWDSLANHSIAMNLAKSEIEGYPVRISAQEDILDSASIVLNSKSSGYFLLGGGGPKNFIQQTGPTLSQILGIPYEGADHGIQIGTALEREGSLSGCTFSEAVTWGKYQPQELDKLVQIWGDYTIIFPLLSVYVLEQCQQKNSLKLINSLKNYRKVLEKKAKC